MFPMYVHQISVKLPKCFTFLLPASEFNRPDVRLTVEWSQDPRGQLHYDVWCMCEGGNLRKYVGNGITKPMLSTDESAAAKEIIVQINADEAIYDEIAKWLAYADFAEELENFIEEIEE